MPGRRGERRRPVTALTTGRWATTLLTLALLSPLAGVAHGSGEPAPAPSRAHSTPRALNVNATCEARYARAVSELRRGMVTGCLHSLDDAVVLCDNSIGRAASPSDAAIGARASFLRARVLLLDGDWDAAEDAATAAREVERTKNIHRPNRRAPPPSFTRRGRHHRQSQANSETARHRGGVHARVQARARLLDRGRGAANLVAILRLAHHSSESRRRDGPLRVGSARRRAGAQDPPTIPRRTTNPSGGVEAVREDR